MAHSWTCPFCNKATTITENDVTSDDRYLHSGTKFGAASIAYYSVRCPNPECKEVALTVGFYNRVYEKNPREGELKLIESWILRPESNVKPQPDYIPAPIREDYHEACLISSKSPKASATLSRRCLQGMIRDFWGIKKGRLIDEINALEDKIDEDTWEAIKAVKDVGNIGAHMEKDINVIVPVDPGEAELLIEMIEQLFEDWYVKRNERQVRSARMKALAEEKKAIKKPQAQIAADPEPAALPAPSGEPEGE